MEYLLTILTTVVASILAFLLKSQIKENRRLAQEKEAARAEAEAQRAKRDEAIEEGVKQLLSVKLEELYDRWADSETIPSRVYTRWKKIHKAYKGLNGNGTFNHMDEEMDEKRIETC